jgi:triphosphoribosyl-dephospho-CoA synthase
MRITQRESTMLQWTVSQCATLACLLEVTAPKPGNVHRAADFADMGLNDFVASAVAIGPVLEQAVERGVGATVLEAVRATRSVTHVNTNLGMLLLLAPLAAVPRDLSPLTGVADVLAQLTPRDTTDVYAAIRLASPGGMQPRDHDVTQHDVTQHDVTQHDVTRDTQDDEPPLKLLDAMRTAAAWDRIAAQYANGFADLRDRIVPWLSDAASRQPLPRAIVETHVRTMAELPDTLIARKCGTAVAEEAAARAQFALSMQSISEASYEQSLADLDFWLRSDGHRRNPGTTADLIAAALFVTIREGIVGPPFQ